ncbi:MAG: Hsp20/alpha crystallin family protein [Candidatus Berkelbacteria bacterium]|nr:MAG: Hsp20/alpha crystallin family protein [Candidatus Berkelbacteria bacterium]QQG51713.1 MAG: Hsp20/alpha crystallin family protein [Candidatus Berkelbacteria bacterium]
MAKNEVQLQGEEWLEEEEGQLAIDAYQDDENVYIKAPIAGVNVDDLEISITDEVVSVKGARRNDAEVAREGYFVQECYWGNFMRSYILPVSVDASKAEAKLRDGILTVRIPKQEKTKTRVLKVSAE